MKEAAGHEPGDSVLHEVGACFCRQVRVAGIARRYGGEAFTQMRPAASLVVTYQRAEQMKRLRPSITDRHWARLRSHSAWPRFLSLARRARWSWPQRMRRFIAPNVKVGIRLWSRRRSESELTRLALRKFLWEVKL